MSRALRSSAPFRDEFRAKVFAACKTTNPLLLRPKIIQTYVNRGVERTALYSWWNTDMNVALKAMASGHRLPAVELSGEPLPPKKRVKRPRAVPLKDMPEAKAMAMAGAMGRPTMPGVLDETASAIPFLVRIQSILAQADAMLEHSKGEDGKPRNVRLMTNALELIRRTLLTASRIQEALVDVEEQKRFMRAVMDTLRQEDPAVRDRLIIRLRDLGSTFQHQRD